MGISFSPQRPADPKMVKIAWRKASIPFPNNIFNGASVEKGSYFDTDEEDEEADPGHPGHKDFEELGLDRLDQAQSMVQDTVEKVKATGVHGAKLLLLAREMPWLQRLLTCEVPLLTTGIERDEVTDLLLHYIKRSFGDNDDD